MQKTSEGDNVLVPAKVIIVANIDRDQFRMSADIGWRVMNEHMASRYATAILEKPVEALAGMTWCAAMDNLRLLKDMLPLHLAEVTRHVVNGDRLAVRHASYVVRVIYKPPFPVHILIIFLGRWRS